MSNAVCHEELVLREDGMPEIVTTRRLDGPIPIYIGGLGCNPEDMEPCCVASNIVIRTHYEW